MIISKEGKPVSALHQWNLFGKRVLLRADLNMPIDEGVVLDTFRLERLLPTIKKILEHGGAIVLITHLGRPKQPDPSLSTRLLKPYFAKYGIPVSFAPTVDQAATDSAPVVLLENLRFFPGEKERDTNFAQQLAQLGDYYVNDAFGALHRNDASLTLVPDLFPPERRTIGLLVEAELATLQTLFMPPRQPLCVILGGGKVAEKIPFITHLLSTAQAVLLCPAMALTFAKALGKPVGKSLVEEESVELCQQILADADKRDITIMLPIDYQITRNSLDNPLEYVDAESMPDDGIAISLGPKTIERYAQEISRAQTTLFNGAVGFLNRPETLDGIKALCTAMAKSVGQSIIAGGDAVAAARMFDCVQKISFLSTGGGATLAYLAGQPLPALETLKS